MNRRSFLRGGVALPVAAVVPKVTPLATGGFVVSVPNTIGERAVEMILPLVTGPVQAARIAAFEYGGRRVGSIEIATHPVRIETLYVGDDCIIGPDTTGACDAAPVQSPVEAADTPEGEGVTHDRGSPARPAHLRCAV